MRFTGKMVRDSHPVDQPDGSHRYALNKVLHTSEGAMGKLSDEESRVVRDNAPYNLLDPKSYQVMSM